MPEEAEIVRKVFELRNNGETLQGIADALNAAGFRSKKGKEFKHSAIQTILGNEDTYREITDMAKKCAKKHMSQF